MQDFAAEDDLSQLEELGWKFWTEICLVMRAIKTWITRIQEVFRSSETFWLPDTFCYSAQLPQIMQHCGMQYLRSKNELINSQQIPVPFISLDWDRWYFPSIGLG
uniref:Glyco_hydro_38N domain-containing protein n=1 Tax=Wuchereria bancrofti TaxID=6293 RepID=A0A1I8ERZ6_WUCBA